jgi:hypothetical protein
MMKLDSLRRDLGARGLTSASLVPEASGGRMEEASISLARVVEGSRLGALPVSAAPHPSSVAFLDGVQRSEIVAYAGSSPLLVAEIAAAVRERQHRKLYTVMEDRQRLVLGRPSALALAKPAVKGMELLPLPDDEPPHPVRDLLQAARALDRARGALEIALAERYRARSDGWLVVDGALSDSPRWAVDPRIVAVSKSHSVLPFEGPDLERYLRLPSGHRSSIYEPRTRSLAPVRAWALRLWPWEGKDLLYGLVRIEVAPASGSPEQADLISGWLLRERAPLSAPDQRCDRLLYGIYSVEQYLRARG